MYRHKKAIATLTPIDPYADVGLSTATPGVVAADAAADVVPALKPLLAAHRAWERPDPARV